jgi:hypothetical protein
MCRHREERTRRTTLTHRLLEVEATCLDTGRARYIPQLLGYCLDELDFGERNQMVSVSCKTTASEIVGARVYPRRVCVVRSLHVKNQFRIKLNSTTPQS